MGIPRKIVERYSKVFNIRCNSSTLGEMKVFINSLDIPDGAKIVIEIDRYDDPEALYFTYRELETHEEYYEREKKDHYEQKLIADDELTMYNRLKKKFEV